MEQLEMRLVLRAGAMLACCVLAGMCACRGNMAVPTADATWDSTSGEVPEWGEAFRGVEARLTVPRRELAPDEPIRAIVELRHVSDEKRFPAEVGAHHLGLDWWAKGNQGRSGSLFRGREDEHVPAAPVQVGEIFYRRELDLGRDFGCVPPINRKFKLEIAYLCAYEGTHAVGPRSKPVVIEIRVPSERVLDYYLCELLGERAREWQRQRGLAGQYPIDELLNIGPVALARIEELGLKETNAGRADRMVSALQRFGEPGWVTIRRIAEGGTPVSQRSARRLVEMRGSLRPR